MTRASDTARLLGAGATILDGTTITTSDNTEQLSLVSTDADASIGPILRMDRQSASAADGDLLGKVNFVGHNDAGTPEDISYASITGIINDASDGTEDGKIAINTIVAGTETSRIFIDAGETVFNEESADMDFRVESNGNANMLFVDGGNDRVGIGTNSPDFLLTVQSSGATTAKIDTSSTSSYAELLLEDGNAGFAFQTRSDNAQSTGTGSLVLNDRDHSSFPIVIKEGNPTNSFVMSDNGCVTMAFQPAFLAVPSTNQNNISTGTTTVVFDTEVYDQNGDFASNTFTAPITGKYFLGVSLYLLSLDTAATYYQVDISTSNRKYYELIDPNFSADLSYFPVNIGVVADMDANDTAYIRYNQSGGAAQTDINTDAKFMGYLLG